MRQCGKTNAQGAKMAEVAREDDPGRPDSNAWFFRETSLAELLANTQPLRSIADLALDDLTPEEACSFLETVNE